MSTYTSRWPKITRHLKKNSQKRKDFQEQWTDPWSCARQRSHKVWLLTLEHTSVWCDIPIIWHELCVFSLVHIPSANMEKEFKTILQPATKGRSWCFYFNFVVHLGWWTSVDDAIFSVPLFSVCVVSSKQIAPYEAQYSVAAEGGAHGRGEEDRAQFVPQHAGHKVWLTYCDHKCAHYLGFSQWKCCDEDRRL